MASPPGNKRRIHKKRRKLKLKARNVYFVKGKLRFKRMVKYFTGNTYDVNGALFTGTWEFLSDMNYHVFNHPSLQNLPGKALAAGTIKNGIFEFKIERSKSYNNLFILIELSKAGEILIIAHKTVSNNNILIQKGKTVEIKVDFTLVPGKTINIDLGILDVKDKESEKVCMLYHSLRHVYNWCKSNKVKNFSKVGDVKVVWPVDTSIYKKRVSAYNSKQDLIWMLDKGRENMESIIHEFGHLLHWRLGLKNSTGKFGISYDWEWPYENDARGHSLYGEEFEDAAYVEGFAHFFSLLVRNSDKIYDPSDGTMLFDVLKYKSGRDRKTGKSIRTFIGRQVPATVTSILLNYLKNNSIKVPEILEVCFDSKTIIEFYNEWKSRNGSAVDLKKIMISKEVYYRLEVDTDLQNGWDAVKPQDLKKPPILIDENQEPHVKMFSDVKALYDFYGPFGKLPDDIKAAKNKKNLANLMGESLKKWVFPREFHNLNRRHNKTNYTISNNLYVGDQMPALYKKYIVPKRKPLDIAAPSSGLQPRITVVGPCQGIRVTYPDPKKGGLITQAFLAELKASATIHINEAVYKIGLGKHKYGALNLPQFEEPSFTDFGDSVSKSGGKALVIGNGNYDESKKMGSSALQNTKLATPRADADKVETVLKTRGFNVTKLHDQTGAGLKSELKKALILPKTGESFVFYFCGHGTFEGLIGIDGVVLPISEIMNLVNHALKIKFDLSIILDACHQGIVVEKVRRILLDRVEVHNKSEAKSRKFIKEVKDLAVYKDAFNSDSRSVLETQWKIENTKPLDSNRWSAHYNKRKDAWNKFVTNANPHIDSSIKARNDILRGFANTQLTKCTATDVNQDEEKKMWAQLDSVDMILNQGVAVRWFSVK